MFSNYNTRKPTNSPFMHSQPAWFAHLLHFDEEVEEVFEFAMQLILVTNKRVTQMNMRTESVESDIPHEMVKKWAITNWRSTWAEFKDGSKEYVPLMMEDQRDFAISIQKHLPVEWHGHNSTFIDRLFGVPPRKVR